VFDVKKELLDSHEALLDVVFEEATVDEAKRRAARKISREINIPGFRRGRAPYTKVLQYVGEPSVLQEAAEALLDEVYSQILDKAEVAPYGPGEFVDMQLTPLAVKIKVPLEPDVALGDYQAIREAWEAPAVSDEEIEQILAQVREEHAVLEPVDRASEMGDQVIVNVKAVADDDVIVEEDDIEVVLSEDRPFLSTAFVEALVGMGVDETREFSLALPDTIDEPSLRGAEADFTVKVTKVFARVLPELDDALASTVGAFETVAELEQDIRDRLQSSKHDQAESAYRSKLVAQLVEQASVVYPPQMIEEALDDIVAEATQQVERQRSMPLEDALRLDGMTMEQFRDQMRPQAEQRVKRSLVLGAFARAESVDVSDDEIVQEHASFFGRFNLAPPYRQIDIESTLGQNLRSSVLGRKVMDRLSQIGRGEQPEVTRVAEVAADEGASHEVVSDDVVVDDVASGDGAPDDATS
jgi:trigger factor